MLARTDPEFISLLKDPRNFSRKKMNKLFGRKFVKEMSADERKMEDIRQRLTKFVPRDGNMNSAATESISPSEDCFVSSFLVIRKKLSGFRPIINLKPLN